MKEAYLHRLSNRTKPPWRSLWCNNKASPRSVICLWQILRNRLPTKDRLNKWGINCDAHCVLCQHALENRNHLFHGHRFIQEFHQYVSHHISFPWPSSFESTVQLMNKLCKCKYSKAGITVMVWTELLYQVWLQRNARIFG